MTFDLSGVRVELVGLHEAHRSRLGESWQAFACSAAGRAADLRIELRYGEARVPTTFRPKAMRFERCPGGARYAMEQGRLEVDTDGSARVELVGAEGGEAWFALMNFVRAALAWTLPCRPAGLVHAAGAVVDGVGWILVGAEGAGKSTWARTAEEGGARVVSDDLVLVDRADGVWALCDAPFHSTHTLNHRPGRWPLGGILFPSHGRRPALAPAGALIARARWLANLPFVDAALDAPHLDALTRAVDELPCRQLTFAPDPGWLECLR